MGKRIPRKGRHYGSIWLILINDEISPIIEGKFLNSKWRKYMITVIKWITIVFASLVGLLVVAVMVLFVVGNSRIYQVEVPVRPVRVTADPETLARGEYLVRTVSACTDCHGANLEGKLFVDEPAIGSISAPNLTSGAGGIGGSYTLEDWARAIRHGVGADGRALGGMPSDGLAHLSDEDLAAIIAYIQSTPAVDNELPPRSLSFIGTILFGALTYQDLPVAKIDHNAVGSTRPVESVSAEYGKYLVDIASCRDCHGADLGGRSPDEAVPGPPPGPDLTTGGNLGGWTADDFLTAIKTGLTPDGRRLDPQMPWPTYAGMSDDELHAIWLYLQNLPALP
jgi:mono/diheme cytochrome c family protein